jgi:hypothetical protein
MAILHMCVGLGGGDDGGGGCGIVLGSTDPESMRLLPTVDCCGLWLMLDHDHASAWIWRDVDILAGAG